MKHKLSLLLTLLLISSAAQAQFSLPSIPDIPIDLSSISDIPGIGNILEEEPAITSCLDDAISEAPDMDGFEPEFFTPLYDMPVSSDGMIFLLPGAYVLETRSYCINAGTYVSDTGGNGYIYAPLVGDRREIIQAILDRSSNHSEIPQTDVQALIWAVLAKYEFTDMNTDMQRTVTALLTSEEIFELNGGMMGLIPDDMMDDVFGDLPEPIRAVMEAEAELRNTLSRAGSSYAELEEIAILAGNPPDEYNEKDIPEGRWSLHPAGYYIRYFPTGYSFARVEIWVPENKNIALAHRNTKAIGSAMRKNMPFHTSYSGFSSGDFYNPPNGVAVPGNTQRQRLLTDSKKDPNKTKDEIQKIKDILSRFSAIAGIPIDLLGVVNLGPSWVFGTMLDMIVDTWGTAISALEGETNGTGSSEDSGDSGSDYTDYTIPVVNHVDSLPGHKSSSGKVAALNSFAEATMALNAVTEATLISENRMNAALNANDEYWASEQALCYIFYKKLSGEFLEITADRFENLLDVYHSEGMQDIYITTAMASEYLNDLRANGFSSEAIAVAHFMRMTDEQIQNCLNTRLSFTAQELEGSLFDAAENCISFMHECGSEWQLLPDVDPHWLEGVEYPQYNL